MATVRIDSDGVPFWEQRADSHLDYTLDWTRYLAGLGDTVVSAVWSAADAGLALSSAIYTASGAHTVWVGASAGNVGSSYVLRSKIFTSEGRIDNRSIKVTVT